MGFCFFSPKDRFENIQLKLNSDPDLMTINLSLESSIGDHVYPVPSQIPSFLNLLWIIAHGLDSFSYKNISMFYRSQYQKTHKINHVVPSCQENTQKNFQIKFLRIILQIFGKLLLAIRMRDNINMIMNLLSEAHLSPSFCQFSG